MLGCKKRSPEVRSRVTGVRPTMKREKPNRGHIGPLFFHLVCLCLIAAGSCRVPTPEDSYSALLGDALGILRRNRLDADAAAAGIEKFRRQSEARVRGLRKSLENLEPHRAMIAFERLDEQYLRILSYVEQNEALRGSTGVGQALEAFMP